MAFNAFKKRILCLMVVCTATLTLNVSAKESIDTSSIPPWVLNPVVDDGLAAVDCVAFSGNVSVDAKLASSNARLALSQQIETRVEGVDETFDSRESQNGKTEISTKFSSVSKQITNQILSGSKILRSDVVNIGGENFFCSLASLNPTKTKALFNTIVDKSNNDLQPQLKEELYQQFKAGRMPDLEQQLKNVTDSN